METKEVMLYTITIISILAFVYLIFGTLTKIPVTSDKKFISMTGNAVLDSETNFKVGEFIKGDITISQKETNETVYGIILLTKDNSPVITRTFNLKNVSIKDHSGKDIIKIENLINYQFTEVGNYELLFSVLDFDINIKKEILVK